MARPEHNQTAATSPPAMLVQMRPEARTNTVRILEGCVVGAIVLGAFGFSLFAVMQGGFGP